MIEIKILEKFGAVRSRLNKGQVLFREGDNAFFYYQILSGELKMNNYDEEGNETIQGIFKEGQSFGEPPLFGEFAYPANAEAIVETELIKLEKHRFLEMLKVHPDISIALLATLSTRLRFKAILSKEIKSYDAEHRIMTLLDFLKPADEEAFSSQIDLTRQTIANLTGLRVETVIRSIKKLEGLGRLKIVKRKIYV